MTVNLHLYPAEQDGTGRVKILWEGSVRASDRVFRALPNATVRNLLVKFGQNFERLMRVEKDYQRMIRREQAGLEPVSAD